MPSRLVMAGLVLWATHARAAEDCAPAAVVEGPEDVAPSIRSGLVFRGIEPSAAAGCSLVTARVEHAGELLRLTMTDSDGRESVREIRDVATATALIDSFTRQEIADPVLGMMPEESTIATPVVATAAVASAPLGPGLSLRTESAYANDDSTWVGAVVTGCMRVGPVCAGGLVRAAAQTAWTSDDAHERTGYDLAATADLPLRAGPLRVTPGAGLGGSWTRYTVLVGPHLTPESQNAGGLRLGAHVAVGLPVGGGFAVELDLGADAALARDPQQPASFGRAALGVRWEPR